jgi:hypothetical protein
VSARAIELLAAINTKQPFYSIDLKRIEARVAQHSLIKQVHVRRELQPASIVISVEERKPVAMLKSDSTGETYIIDRDAHLLRPKLITGLSQPARLMAVPLLSGVGERDTIGWQAMSKLVLQIESVDSGALRNAIGELRRTPTGAFMIYTAETQTPIFIGSPFDAPFQTALDAQRGAVQQYKPGEFFTSQIDLLAHAWHKKLERALQSGDAIYVDARFKGEIILKHRTNSSFNTQVLNPNGKATSSVAASMPTNSSIPKSYATNANERSIH